MAEACQYGAYTWVECAPHLEAIDGCVGAEVLQTGRQYLQRLLSVLRRQLQAEPAEGLEAPAERRKLLGRRRLRLQTLHRVQGRCGGRERHGIVHQQLCQAVGLGHRRAARLEGHGGERHAWAPHPVQLGVCARRVKCDVHREVVHDGPPLPASHTRR